MTAINILHISLSEQWVLHAYDVPEIYVGEHNATQIIIHPDVVMESTSYTLDFLDASGHDFYKVLAVSNGSLSCMVTQADLACAGTLTAQIVATKSDQTIKRSNKIRFKAQGSILSSNAAPTTQVTAFTEAIAQYASDLQIAKTQRVGYVEYVGNVMSFYTDSTKATRLAQVTVQSGGSSYDDTAIRNRLTAIEQQESAWNAKANTSDIPSALSDLTDDATHRTVTDTEKATWNAKSTFSGSYNDLTGKPTIPTDDHISEIATQAIPSADITANTSARHTHANKTVIDGISAEDIERWNEGGGSGGSEKWELINSVTVSEDVVSVRFTTDSDGNPFKLSKLIIISSFIGTANNLSVGVYGGTNTLNPAWGTGVLLGYFGHGAGFAANSTVSYQILKAEKIPEYPAWVSTWARSGNDTSVNGNVYPTSNQSIFFSAFTGSNSTKSLTEVYSAKESYLGDITGITKVFIGSYGTALGAGTEIRMYGVKE